jgi:carboxyl-terminal processing protease
MMIQIYKSLVLALLLSLPVMSAADEETSSTDAQLTLDDLRTFTDVFNQIRNNFIEETSDRELLNAAIRGMLSELDPHSLYMEADQFRQLDNSSQGRYSGIGVEVLIRDKRINIVHVMDGGAADKAGVVAGDIITSIDQQDVRGQHLPTAIDRLRGEVGTEVEVTIEHENGEVSQFLMVRDFIKVASVFSQLLDRDYGYFQITHFTLKSADELLEQIENLKNDHDGALQGVILDLRNNPGGVLNPAITVADGFLDNGLIVSTRGRAPNQLEYTANPGQWLQDNIPVVVLVNRSSASASEVLAGALQDHGRALIVGERTFGKGSVQSVLNLRNGAGMRLTTSRYYTPSGRSIQAEGIQPDVEIFPVQIIEDDNEDQREADLDRHLNGEPGNGSGISSSEVSAADDYMLYQALILLKGASILSSAVQQPRGISK